MILPQHRDLLFDSRQKQREYQPPELAEDEVEEISRLISWSMEEEKLITLIYAERFGPKRITGVVVQIDPIERWLIIQGEKDRRMIPLAQIVGTGGMKKAPLWVLFSFYNTNS